MPKPFFSFNPEVSPVCQIGMSDKRQAEPDSWLDVSCYVHEAELFRGRERFNDRFEPGTATITFSNDDGWADLVGAYSAVAAQKLRPGRQIRIGVRGPWNRGQAPFVRWLWRGFIDQSKPAYDPVEHDFVTVNAIDALGETGSAVAPTGDFQGVNETATARINRVLNAVGWFNSKRSIAATTTRVQGTELGGAAIDHMGQAADTAGGVVFGNLNGDVVFRDIDWMLYKATVAEDDEIGNCTPGTPPIDDKPPYHDPDPGPIHDPDDPPATHPPRVCVCSDGRDGTIVEKGDLYKIYVKNGHLYYYSQGHTWDLGPYSGGCTCISPPSPDPRNPPTPPTPPFPPTPPIRYDPPPVPPGDPEPPEDTWPPYDPPADPVPSLFAVEFLGYSDAGLSDPPAAAVTVAGIAPGHDCLLVVLIDALGSATNTSGLAPVVSGGSLDWAHSRGVDRTEGVASSFIVATEVGRDDPGTFDVVVTWAAPMTSRTHIVTVWKVTAAVNDYLTRFDAGAVLAAVLTSTPPEFINPGDGPVTVPLASDRQPIGLDALTRISDITIAQSLAEETTGPYGAVLSEADGPWTTPLFADIPTPPAPGLLAAGDFNDDFERADGPLGDLWVHNLLADDDNDISTLSTISNGVAVTALDTGSGAVHDWATYHSAATLTTSGGRVVEFEVARCAPAFAVYVYAQMNDTDLGRQYVYVQFNSTSDYQVDFGHTTPDVGDDVSIGAGLSAQTYTVGDSITFRYETDDDGSLRLFRNGVLVLEAVDPAPVTGQPYVGFSMNWRGTASPASGLGSFRTGAAVCDDFDRADGPLGASWVSTNGIWQSPVRDLIIVDGGAEDGATAEDGFFGYSASRYAAPQPADQSIEAEIGRIWQDEPADVGTGHYAMLFLNMSDTDQSLLMCEFNFDRNVGISVDFINFDADGNSGDDSGNWNVPLPDPLPDSMRVRAESDAGGTARAYVGDALVGEWANPTPRSGSFLGIGTSSGDHFGTITTFVPSVRFTEACIGGAGGGGGIVRKCSWVAGWRQGITSATVMVEDVNTGVDNYQSAQACLVLESGEASLGHRVLDYDLRADPTGATPGGTLLLTNQPRAGTFVVVFVGVTANADVIDAVTVSGADLTRNHVQHKTGESWGQGSIWTCQVPLDVDLSGWAITVTHPDVESVSAVAYEVTAQDATTPVGGVASGVLGTIAAGSVDGPSSITMSAPGDVGGVGLAFLHVSAEPSTTSGAASLDGDEWHEDLQYSPAIHGGYLQTQSRAPGQEASTSTDVHWDDVQTGTALTFSGVQLAIEVRHAADAFGTAGSADPVYLGGRTDAFNGPITSAKATDPLTGEIIWAFP